MFIREGVCDEKWEPMVGDEIFLQGRKRTIVAHDVGPKFFVDFHSGEDNKSMFPSTYRNTGATFRRVEQPCVPEEEVKCDGGEPSNQKITSECDEIKAMLLEKNVAYGNSALDPVRVFSKSDAVEQIKVRIDDKISRLMRGKEIGDDTVLDLIGYLVLLRVAMKGAK